MKTIIEQKNYKESIRLYNKYQYIDTMLKHASNDSVRTIIDKKIKRAQNKPEESVKTFCDLLIYKKIYSIAKALPDECYSMGSTVRVYFNNLSATDDRTREYARSSKYRAKHGYVSLRLSLDELLNTKVIGGLVTYIYPSQKQNIKKCYWYEGKGSKNNFELVKIQGFIYEGFHSTDKQRAKEGGKRRLELAKQKTANEKKYQKALNRKYSFQDSLFAGNCEVGTKAFILRCGLSENKKYKGSFLLKIAKEKSYSSVSFIEKMVKYFSL